MSFRYSFQKIVDLKENEKTQAEWMLSGALGHLHQEEEQLKSLFLEKNELHDRFGQAVVNKVTVSDLLDLQQYMSHLERRIERQSADVQQAEHNVHQKRDQLTYRAREEKVWTQARHKAYEQFKQHNMKKEQEALDEMAVTRHKKLS